MGLFDGIGDAELYERGQWFPPGFRGTLAVKRTLAKESVKSGIGFLVEFEVVEVRNAGTDGHENSPVVVGEKRTWWQGMSDKTVAFPAIKEFAAAVAGYPLSDKAGIEADVAPYLSDTLNQATAEPADNDFVGMWVELQTSHKLTKKKNDFTVHMWAPHVENEEQPTDAVDEVS